jgi:hypothetical protein
MMAARKPNALHVEAKKAATVMLSPLFLINA